MMVTVFGWSGLTNAYRSVLSAVGSWLISGASRWLDALPGSIWSTTSAATAPHKTSFLTPILPSNRSAVVATTNERRGWIVRPDGIRAANIRRKDGTDRFNAAP